MLDSMAEGVCCVDTRGDITFLNRTGAQLLELDPAEALGQNFHEIAHQNPAHAAAFPPEDCSICQNLRSGQTAFVKHEMFWRPNGTTFPVEYSAQPLSTADGSLGMIVTFTDVTRRQIHSQEMLYILASAKCLLWYGDVHYVRSKGKLRWFLWPADQEAAQRFLPFPIAPGQSFADAYYACRLDEDKKPSDEYGTQHVLEGRNYHQEYRCRRLDGEIRWIAEDVQLEPIGEDRWRAVGVCTDITELKLREQEIARLNEQLRRTVMETHHRVKNNLQIIAALIELQTIDEPLSLPLAEFARLSQHVRSLATIHDLLTAESKTSSQLDLLSSRSVLEQLVKTIGKTTGKARLRYDIEDTRLSSHQCTSLALVTNELISNAMKHGRDQIHLRFTARDGNALLEVSDDGPGFPQDFDPIQAANTGLDLIETLTRKDLSGQSYYGQSDAGGARVVIEFPLPVN
jgi:PAS domain S-box-containing protein